MRVLNSWRIWSSTGFNTTQPLPATHCLYMYFDTERGGGTWTREKVRGSIVHKACSKYQHDWLYLQSINICRKVPLHINFLRWRHFVLVSLYLISPWSQGNRMKNKYKNTKNREKDGIGIGEGWAALTMLSTLIVCHNAQKYWTIIESIPRTGALMWYIWIMYHTHTEPSTLKW